MFINIRDRGIDHDNKRHETSITIETIETFMGVNEDGVPRHYL